MKLSLLYNWPQVEDKTTLSLGGGNVEDHKYEFQILFKHKDQKETYRLGKSDWISYENAKEIKHTFNKGVILQISKRIKDDPVSEKLIKIIDTSKEWPSSAFGDTSTDVSFDF